MEVMKNKIILVSGYAATGKSTFSRKLAQELNIPCFNKDTIKEVLGDGFGSESGEVFKKGSYVTFILMLHIAECFMQAERICILESNFKVKEIEEIIKLLEKYNGECFLFRFICDLNVAYDRYITRDNAGERHWVHKGAGDIEGFKQTMSERFGLDDVEIANKIDVDTTSFENVNYEDLFTVAKKFIL